MDEELGRIGFISEPGMIGCFNIFKFVQETEYSGDIDFVCKFGELVDIRKLIRFPPGGSFVRRKRTDTV